MLVSSHSDWPLTCHNDFSAGEQPNLKRLLLSENQSTFWSVTTLLTLGHAWSMTTLHTLSIPPLGLPSTYLPVEIGTKSFLLPISLIHNWWTHLQHRYLPSASATLLFLTCITFFVILPVPNWQGPHGVSPQVPSLGMPWTWTSLKQPATNLNKQHLVHCAKLEGTTKFVLLPLAEP